MNIGRTMTRRRVDLRARELSSPGIHLNVTCSLLISSTRLPVFSQTSSRLAPLTSAQSSALTSLCIFPPHHSSHGMHRDYGRQCPLAETGERPNVSTSIPMSVSPDELSKLDLNETRYFPLSIKSSHSQGYDLTVLTSVDP